MDQRAKAEALRDLHIPGDPLLLLNAWDAASAVVIARGGARAIATSSAAAANALGYADGQHLTRAQMLGAVAAIADAVDLPVTADMEAGYGDEPEAAAATARGVVRVGAVGLNMEDLSDGSEDLLPIERFAAKIAAVRAVGGETGVPLVLNARTDVFLGQIGDPGTRLERAVGDETGIPLVLNARTDVFLGQVGDPGTRLEHAVERGRAYLAAGADCIFVPGVIDPSVITALVQGIDGPVSILAVPGSPPLTELKAFGVARISTGSGPYRAALSLARTMAGEADGAGTLDSMIAAQVAFADAQALFAS